jgi:uncharacterized glyoxalase superfamily protein PhnB
MTAYPCLSYRDPRAAAEFLERAFGFEPVQLHEGPDGTLAHVEMRAGDGLVMFGPPDPRWGDHVGTGWVYVALGDVDRIYERAREAGAQIVMEPTDTDYGSRDFTVRDPEGNLWSFGTYEPE